MEFEKENAEISVKFDCKYQKGPQRGLYANRNCAALACSGTHVRTMDDDHTFPIDHWTICEEAVRMDPQAFWSIGETSLVDDKPWGVTDSTIQLHPSGLGCSPENLDKNWAISDGATIYPSLIFFQGNRMIESFSYGSSYLEFGAYLYSQGYMGRYLQSTRVIHHASLSTLNRSEPSVDESRLFASLAYNLYFRPSLRMALRHFSVCIFTAKHPLALLLSVPRLYSGVQKRWRIKNAVL
jgi:hypothetical protein